jgi:hypothetical protein
MANAVFHHRSHVVRPSLAQRDVRRLPIGQGLLIGATVSLGLWAGLFWLAAMVFG